MLNYAKETLGVDRIATGHYARINYDRASDRYQLFANLEDNLIQFLSLPNNHDHSEYQQLLIEAIQIGLSVHQEVRKIQTLN